MIISTTQQLTNTEHFVTNNAGDKIPFSRLLEIRPHTIVNKGVPPYLFLPEIRQIIQQASSLETAFFIDFLFSTGARLNEVLQVRKSDCFFESYDARKPHAILKTLKQRKKNVTRYVPLEPTFASNLRQFSNSIKNDDFIFGGSTDRTWRNRIYSEVAKHDFGFNIKISPHTFRHSCAVHLVLSHYDILDIKEWLGHANVKDTQRYSAVSLELKREIRPQAIFR